MLPQRALTADKLAEAIGCTLDDPAASHRAHALGDRINDEDGTNTAVIAIEKLLHTAHR